MKYTLIFSILFILLNCTQTPDNIKQYQDFPETILLKSTVVEIDTAIFRYPFRIRIDDDRAIIMDLHNADYYYHLFDYPDFNYKSSYGKRGQSPEEILSADNFRIHRNFIYALDANKREIKTYSFSVDRDSVTEESSLTVEEAILRPLDFVHYDDHHYIIPDYSGQHRFCWVDTEGKILRKTGTIPTTNKKALNSVRPALAQAWRSFVDYNPRNNILAAVTQLGEVLEIYNLKDSTHTVIMGPAGEPEFQVNDNYAVPSGIMGFSDIQLTDKYIYAVFHGRTFRELSQQKEPIDGGQYIYMFDLQGNPVRRYILDSYIYGISVDEEEGIIMATDVNRDNPVLKFELP